MAEMWQGDNGEWLLADELHYHAGDQIIERIDGDVRIFEVIDRIWGSNVYELEER